MDDPPPLIRPAPGPVRAAFDYDRATPFAAGQRRGTTFTVRPGTTVAAPCRGRITFAGRTPRGAAVTVRCGAWTTTVLGVSASVRPGASVPAGRTVGRASGAVVGLSLRPVAERWGYVDPDPSVAAPRTGTPLGPAPRTRWSPPPVRLRTPDPEPARVPRPVPNPLERPAPSRVRRPLPVLAPDLSPAVVAVDPDPDRRVQADPRVVWLGLGLAALGLPALRRRRRSGRQRGGAATGLRAEPRGGRGSIPSIGNGLLRHDTDLLRQRRATPRSRVLDDRR